MKMNKKCLMVSMLSAFAGQTYAAGLERSPQQIDALFESGTYAEVSYAHVAPDISGKDASGNRLSDMAEDFQSLGYAVKTDITPNLRLAVIYDEPFGAEVSFDGENDFIDPNTSKENASTSVKVQSKNLTTLLGYNLNKNFMVYAGPALQDVKSKTRLRGLAYGVSNGYNNRFSDDLAVGWVAGLSYAKPEMGILASLTYRSEIEHEMYIYEDDPLSDLLGISYEHRNKGSVTTPESVNLNLQTGLNMSTVLFSKVRYVPWSKFEFRPPVLEASTAAALGKGLALVDYHKDQTAVEVGLGKQVMPKLAVAVSGLWDSGAGDPVTTLGPVEGFWGLGLAAKYNVNENVALSLGGRYMWFGDAKGEKSDRTIVADFKDNTGYIVGAKLSYSSK